MSDETQRTSLMIHVTKDMREHLEAAAIQGGRSLTEEVEARLENSIRDDDLSVLRIDLEDLRASVRALEAIVDEIRFPNA